MFITVPINAVFEAKPRNKVTYQRRIKTNENKRDNHFNERNSFRFGCNPQFRSNGKFSTREKNYILAFTWRKFMKTFHDCFSLFRFVSLNEQTHNFLKSLLRIITLHHDKFFRQTIFPLHFVENGSTISGRLLFPLVCLSWLDIFLLLGTHIDMRILNGITVLFKFKLYEFAGALGILLFFFQFSQSVQIRCKYQQHKSLLNFFFKH